MSICQAGDSGPPMIVTGQPLLVTTKWWLFWLVHVRDMVFFPVRGRPAFGAEKIASGSVWHLLTRKRQSLHMSGT